MTQNNLKAAISDFVRRRGGIDGPYPTPAEGFVILKSDSPTLPYPMIYGPSLCVIAQGKKRFLCGSNVFEYCGGQGLIVSVETPATGQVTDASPSAPYLAVALEIDIQILRQVMTEMEMPPALCDRPQTSVSVLTLESPIMDSLTRLVLLAGRSAEAVSILQKGLMREICFWLLKSAAATEVGRIAFPSRQTLRIAEALAVLRERFATAIKVEELADAAKMSSSSFHDHFKSLTGLTPLQYQKQLRLVEARRLLTADGVNVAHVAYEVGYQSPSHFGRDYARMFGNPPRRDAATTRSAN